jgi:hypothetical protein
MGGNRTCGYFLKWRTAAGETAAPAVRFSTKMDAMDSAGVVLGRHPGDIWIEDDLGSRVAHRTTILRHLKLQSGSQPVPAA